MLMNPFPPSFLINFSSPLTVFRDTLLLLSNFIQCAYICICVYVYMHVHIHAAVQQFIGTFAFIFVLHISGFRLYISACKCANY